jgi:hypothetical protein
MRAEGAEPRSLGVIRRVALDRAGSRWALLREPSGFDEERVGGRSTLEAIHLLDRLLCSEPGAAVQPGSAAALTVAERDLLLAAAWRMAWGATISGTLACGACARPFDFDFCIDTLVDEVHAGTGELPVEDGVYTLPGGCRFRLPTGHDELALAGATGLGVGGEAAERALLERCLVEGDVVLDGPAVVAAMERVATDLDVELDAACSECGHHHAVRFQIQDYLLGAISSDWGGLLEDLHRLALAYRWSMTEILSLPRSRRRALVALLDGDAIPRSRELR